MTSALTRMLGTNVDLTEFYRFTEHQPKLDALALQFEGVKPPRFPTIFGPWSMPWPVSSSV